MENNFKNLGLDEALLKGVEALGFAEATDVQAHAIPEILKNKDLIVMSKTGSGKTGAFGLPILQAVNGDKKEVQALILAPTRELAVQVESDLKDLGKFTSIKTAAIYGQHNMNTEITELKNGVQVVAGTPGRVMDHIKRKTLKTKDIQFLVLDEADRMLDMGFIDQVVQIIKSLPKKRVTLLFSATMPPEIQRICKSYMNEPVNIELETETKTVDSIEQLYYKVARNEKRTWLDNVLKLEQPDSCMIFCNTRIEVDRVCQFLHNKDYMVEALHGANNQTKRMKTINKFKDGHIQILVATDVAARGLHVEELSLVINYDLPEDRNSYVHRIGRTGRAGKSGRAISLVTSDDFMLLYEIEEHVGVLIDEAALPNQVEIKSAVDNATGKWVGVKPAPRKEKSDEDHGAYGNKKKSTGNRNNKKRVQTKHTGSKPQKSADGPKANAGEQAKSTRQTKPAQHTSSKPSTKHIKPTVVATSQDHHAHSTASAVKSDVKKQQPKPKREKKHVKGLGEIEFIVTEPKKQGILDKVKGIFKK